MMMYKLLVLLALVLTANGAHRFMQISVISLRTIAKLGEFGATGSEKAEKKITCCEGNYTLQLILENGLSDTELLDLETEKNTEQQGDDRLIMRHKHHVRLPHQNETVRKKHNDTYGLLKGFIIQYTKDPENEENYASQHRKFGFQRVLQMKLWPTEAKYPRKEEPACVFNMKDEYEKDKYTVVCHLKPKKNNPSWLKKVKKQYPHATYFESVKIPALIGASIEGGEMSAGMYEAGMQEDDSDMEGEKMSAGDMPPGFDGSGLDDMSSDPLHGNQGIHNDFGIHNDLGMWGNEGMGPEEPLHGGMEAAQMSASNPSGGHHKANLKW